MGVVGKSGLLFPKRYNDASADIDGGLEIYARTSTPEYQGFKLSFGPANVKTGFFNEYKAPFKLSGTDWERVYIPFTSFSQDWSSFTGACDTTDPNGKQHHCCSADHPENCPTA